MDITGGTAIYIRRGDCFSLKYGSVITRGFGTMHGCSKYVATAALVNHFPLANAELDQAKGGVYSGDRRPLSQENWQLKFATESWSTLRN